MGARAAVATHGGGRTLGSVVEAVAPGAVADLGSADDDLGGVGSEDPERGGGRLGQDNGKLLGILPGTTRGAKAHDFGRDTVAGCALPSAS